VFDLLAEGVVFDFENGSRRYQNQGQDFVLEGCGIWIWLCIVCGLNIGYTLPYIDTDKRVLFFSSEDRV